MPWNLTQVGRHHHQRPVQLAPADQLPAHRANRPPLFADAKGIRALPVADSEALDWRAPTELIAWLQQRRERL